MELHASLACAVPNSGWVEYIPQLDSITTERPRIERGQIIPSSSPGIGIDWDWDAIASCQDFTTIVVTSARTGTPVAP